jgi:hypothetical protein
VALTALAEEAHSLYDVHRPAFYANCRNFRATESPRAIPSDAMTCLSFSVCLALPEVSRAGPVQRAPVGAYCHATGEGRGERKIVWGWHGLP